MGNICSSEQDDRIDNRSHSIFRDMKDGEKLKKRFCYENNFQIGPYFQEEQENKSKIIKWEKMAKKSQRKSSQKVNDVQNNKFMVNKIDKMLFDISVSNQESFQKNIRDGGPPAALRWGVWKTMLYKNVKYESGLYERLIEKLDDNPQYSQIQKDIIRTFPEQYYFSHSGMQGKSLGHQQLHRVLGAISTYFPNSYCQSMNFILGLLIMVSGGSEIDVFWSFVSLVRNRKFLIIGLYEDGMPLLKFLEFITKKLMKKHLPKIQNVFEELMVPSGFWLVKWFMTMYIYAFPVNVCIRIWDYVLAEGIFALVTIMIPILKNFENYLEQMDDLEDMERFQEMTRQADKEDSDFYMNMQKIIKEADKYLLKPKAIVKYAKEYIQENDQLQNEYVQMYLKYDDDQQFEQLVEEFIAPKVYTHHSRTHNQSMESNDIYAPTTKQSNASDIQIQKNKSKDSEILEVDEEGYTQVQTEITNSTNQNETNNNQGESNYMGEQSQNIQQSSENLNILEQQQEQEQQPNQNEINLQNQNQQQQQLNELESDQPQQQTDQ